MSYNIAKKNNDLYDSLNSLTYLSTTISTEGVSSFLEKVTSFFVSKVGYVREALGITSSEANKVSSDVNVHVKELIDLKKSMQSIISNKSYASIEKDRVMSPVGIKVDLVKLSNELKSVMKLTDNEVFECIERLDTYVSSVLNDVDFRTQTKPQSIDKEAIKYADRLYSNLNTCIDSKKIEDTRLVKELLPNLSSLDKVYDNLIDISNYTSVNKLNNINKAIENVYAKTEVLEQELGGKYEVSKVILKKLIEDLENNAKLITVYVNTIYLYNQTVICVNTLIKKYNVK